MACFILILIILILLHILIALGRRYWWSEEYDRIHILRRQHCIHLVVKEPIVALFTYEAEYVVGSLRICCAFWLRELLKNLYFAYNKPIVIYADNKLTIALSKNPLSYERSKHINTLIISFRSRLRIKKWSHLR